MNLKTLIAASVIAVLPTSAQCAQQGELETNSAASFSITLVIQPAIEIKTSSDISINITDRSKDGSFTHEFCVQGTTPGKYNIIADGTSVDGTTFVLQNEAREPLRYSAAYRGDPVTATFDPLAPGVPSRSYDVLPRADACNGVTAFMITFKAADLQSAGSGLYNGSLTLLVAPV